MHSILWSRLRGPAALMLFLFLGAGCASVADSQSLTSAGSVPVCSSVSCMTQEAANAHYRNCVAKLGQYARSRGKQRAIDAEFRYPLKNEESYYRWVRMGGTGPSPQQWCREYAAQKISALRPVMSLR